MTTVNWERLPGDAVEEFVATLILRGHATGNRVTPSRGDRGIDLRVWNGANWEVYQVKRYCHALTGKQVRDIESSWKTFLAKTLPLLDVKAWHLVMPWDPTIERLAWLDKLTAESGVNANWIGRSQLDYLAAENPQLVDYFYGDGAARLQTLVTNALLAGSPSPDDETGKGLLDAVVERQAALSISLAEVDPFYRYELEVRPGPLPDQLTEPAMETRGAALIVYRQISDTQHTVMRIVPRDALAQFIRPIAQTINFDISHPEHRSMVESFVHFGAPIDQVPAVSLKSVGPPGATMPVGSAALISFIVPQHDDFPELELRLRDENNDVVSMLPLGPAEVSTGIDGFGMRIAAWDTSQSLRAEFRLSRNPDVLNELSVRTSSISGKSVRRVLAVVDFVAASKHGRTIELAIAGGLPVSAGWEAGQFPNEHRAHWADIVHDLVEIQAHTHVVVQVPHTLSESSVKEIKSVAQLLRGEVLRYEPTRIEITLTTDIDVESGPFAVQFHRPINLKLDGQEIPVNRHVRVYSPRARIDVDSLGREGQRVGHVVFDSPGIMQAINPQSAQSDTRPGSIDDYHASDEDTDHRRHAVLRVADPQAEVSLSESD